jgi:hypothetical protein
LLPDIYPVVIIPSIHPSRHPSIQVPHPEEEYDGRRGGRQMAAAAIYYSKIILKEN